MAHMEKFPTLPSKKKSQITRTFGPTVLPRFGGNKRPGPAVAKDVHGIAYARDSRGVIRRLSVKTSKRRKRVDARTARKEERDRLHWTRPDHIHVDRDGVAT